MIKVAKVTSFGGACPTQGEGFLEDGRPFYLRYRGASFRFQVWPKGVDPDDDEGWGQAEELFSFEYGERYDGTLNFEEVVRLTKNYVEWPKFQVIMKYVPDYVEFEDGSKVGYGY